MELVTLEAAFFVVESLAEMDTGSGASIEAIAEGCRAHPRTTRRYMQSLAGFDLVQRVHVDTRRGAFWSLTEAGQGLLRAAQG